MGRKETLENKTLSEKSGDGAGSSRLSSSGVSSGLETVTEGKQMILTDRQAGRQTNTLTDMVSILDEIRVFRISCNPLSRDWEPKSDLS